MDDKEEKMPEFRLSPFKLLWSFGLKTFPLLRNLTSATRNVILYASAHAGVLYDYKTKEMNLLQGHKNFVTSVGADRSGRWVVTADSGYDNAIIVWDSHTCMPLLSMFNPDEQEIGKVELSPNSKYLVAVTNAPQPTLMLWLWTFGRDQPDGKLQLHQNFGKVLRITFNPNVSEEFLVLSETSVASCAWFNGILSAYSPSRSTGDYLCAEYIMQVSQIFISTSTGKILVWKEVVMEPNNPVRKKMNNEKNVQLQPVGITALACIKEVVVTGNVQGEINFYDLNLKILFWCQNFVLDSIISITFISEEHKYKITDEKLKKKKNYVEEENMSVVTNEDESCENEPKIKTVALDNVPKDATLQELPFIVPDFIVLTVSGEISMVNFIENFRTVLIPKNESPVISLDVSCKVHHLCIGLKNGVIVLYDYQSKEFLLRKKLESIRAGIKADQSVTATAYSHDGSVLACGLMDGTLWILDPSVLEPIAGFQLEKESITKIIFSEDSSLMAVKGSGSVLYLFKIEKHQEIEVYMSGKRKVHNLPITDILFFKKPPNPTRLFSVGEDRKIVEYDTDCRGEKLEIIFSSRIEQSAIPQCMITYPKYFHENFILISNSEYKFRIWHEREKMYRQTALGPTIDSTISHLKLFAPCTESESNYMIFASNQTLGIHLLPVDGNPYKIVAMIGHPKKILGFSFSFHEKYLFSFGENDNAVLMWDINLKAADVMWKIGGDGMIPFLRLVEGGHEGKLFNLFQDLCIYCQLIRMGENSAVEHDLSQYINLEDVPELMRAIGFYFTEFEITNLMNEMQCNLVESEDIHDKVEFDELFKLYLNHRPAKGYFISELKKAFDTFADFGELKKSELFEMLKTKGEIFSKSQMVRYLKLLFVVKGVDKTTDPDDFEFLFPDQLSYKRFVSEVLGISMEGIDYEEKEESNSSPPSASDSVSRTALSNTQL